MTPDADQCTRMLAEAAAVASRHSGVTVQITLLCENGYHLWQWAGTPSPALERLAAMPVQGTA
ncbi:MAG: hypothetical protein ACK5QX_06910 [bacterium]|jgi:hypothetical protein